MSPSRSSLNSDSTKQPVTVVDDGKVIVPPPKRDEKKTPKKAKKGKKGGAIELARNGLWRTEGREVLATVAGLSLCASVRNVLQAYSPASIITTAITSRSSLLELGHWALVLYAECWTLYLFLAFFSGAFATLLALAQFQAKVMFDQPLLKATSISDFWSRRWNMLIHGLFKRTVFAPLTRRGYTPWLSGALAFAISGLFHEYAFSLAQPAVRDSLGRCLCFFVAQAPLVSAEKALRKRLGVPRLFRENPAACTAAWTAILVPFAPLFLHPLRTSGVFEQIVSLVPRVEMAGRY